MVTILLGAIGVTGQARPLSLIQEEEIVTTLPRQTVHFMKHLCTNNMTF